MHSGIRPDAISKQPPGQQPSPGLAQANSWTNNPTDRRLTARFEVLSRGKEEVARDRDRLEDHMKEPVTVTRGLSREARSRERRGASDLAVFECWRSVIGCVAVILPMP